MSAFTIRNATVFDGTGVPRSVGDVHVAGGRIVEAGEHDAVVIDATGLALAPGFIDTHTHDDLAVIDGLLEPKISQGVTSVVVGNCGTSLAPFDPSTATPPFDLLGPPEAHRFATFADYLAEVRRVGTTANVVALAGHGTLRAGAMQGSLSRPANADEVAAMAAAADEVMRAGGFGISSGLEYQPARRATTAELTSIAAVASRYGGLYTTHLRDEADGVAEALSEAFQIGRGSGARVVVSHHKCSGRANFGRSVETLAMLDAAAAVGDVAFDVYPYDACSTILSAEFHRNALRTLITGSASVPGVAGRDLDELATEWAVDAAEAIRRLQPAGAVYFDMDEADVRRIVAHPNAMIGSDGIPGDEHPHPRLWGTFARVLGHYARDIGLFTLEEAIRKMTSLPAETFGLTGRGVIERGAHADLVLFDPATIIDRATFSDPRQPAAGIVCTWVAGVEVWATGRATGARPAGPLTPSGRR